MAPIIAGLAGGLVATIVMTAVMKLVGDGGPPPTAALVAKLSGGQPAEHAKPGLVLHLLYGTLAGGVLVVGLPLVGLAVGDIVTTLVLGVLYGLVLMIGGMVFWMRVVIGMEPDRKTMGTFALVHVVYGLVLGAVLGAGIVG